MSFSSIKTYLAAIRYKNITLGFSADFQDMPLLHLLLKGIKRSKGDLVRPLRLPITLPIIKHLKEALRSSKYNEQDKLMLWAAFTTAFFGFLSSSEFCSQSSATFDQQSTLLVSDISHAPNGFLIRIKVSKTDPFRRGHSIRLAASGTSICPVRALKNYMPYCNQPSLPLFTFANKIYLTRCSISNILEELLSGSPFEGHYTSHSFRIGAASTAAAAGVPDWLIKVLGRWSSDCYQRYIRTPANVIDKVFRQLVTSPNTQPHSWVPQKKLGGMW